uniref:Phosphatidylinositol-specific phospholipase C X domain-containing protein n=1 Tax=Megaselia scalaris TaxID=36166 RepID=T1GBM9_MEGSC
SAQDRKVEVTYKNISNTGNDLILLTSKRVSECNLNQWTCDNGEAHILDVFRPSSSESYFKTKVTYKYTDGTEFNKTSKCHSVWAVYLNKTGNIVASTCLMVHPSWVNDSFPNIGNLTFRELVIPGTHDSASYTKGFEIPPFEDPLTRYFLTQDDTILGQLYQGARYLDIRPSNYKLFFKKWYVNHGITIQQSLDTVMDQVKNFIDETGEPVIFGLKEFPIGLPKNPTDPWSVTIKEALNDQTKSRVILAYDNLDIVEHFPSILFPAVKQNWGDKQTWNDLEEYLIYIRHNNINGFLKTPVADMAELTPKITNPSVLWNIKEFLLNRGGLRELADDVNLKVCDLYDSGFLNNANIIAVDFIKGSRITEMAINFNKMKVKRSFPRNPRKVSHIDDLDLYFNLSKSVHFPRNKK